MTEPQAIRFSYEFFPPRNAKMVRRLWRAIGQLERFNPAFFSMTYGALGSTQKVSIDTAIEMNNESSVTVAAHLTCADASSAEIDAVARGFSEAGIKQIVALRGDASEQNQDAGYGYANAAELVSALKTIADFDISVAAYPEVHPQASSAAADLQNLKRKLDAGANRAITQYFFDAECYLRFRDAALAIGIDKPIIPGILPIHNLDKVRQFSASCGASFPAEYQAMYDRVANNAAAQYALSLELAVGLCETLQREGVDQFHLYTLNQTDMCLDISLALGARLAPLHVESAA